MKKLAIALLALALVAPTAALGQTSSIPSMARFQLWDACRPMDLVVEDLSSDAVEAGLQPQDIEVAVRSRLRSARIYAEDAAAPYLYVQVSVLGRAFHIKIEYKKMVRDVSTGLAFPAATWGTGSIGTHGQDSGFILSGVSRGVDVFIDEYLRVNGPDCQ